MRCVLACCPNKNGPGTSTAGRPTVPVEREQVLKRLNANKKKSGKPNVGEVASHFGISRQTVYRMIESVRKRVAEVEDE
jgi:DNA invertase Pin-like site-specific DNA recombinase